MPKTQTIEDMVDEGASQNEARAAWECFEMLKPALKIKPNGRVDTMWGDKTPLGLYRTIVSIQKAKK